MDPIPELLRNVTVPGRNPLEMLKNNEPLPNSSLLLRARVDKDLQAMRITFNRGKMEWKKYTGEVRAELSSLDDQDPYEVELIYTGPNYSQAGENLFNREGAGYTGLPEDQFESHNTSTGEIMISRNPRNRLGESEGWRIALDMTDPENNPELVRIFDPSDLNGVLEACNLVGGQVMGLSINDTEQLKELLQAKLSL